MQKPFKTIKEQVENLRNKNLEVTSYNKLEKILIENNYYILINGFGYVFKNENNDNFREKTTIDNIYSLFTFDRNMRILLLLNIFKIEEKIKALSAYYFSEKNGSNFNKYTAKTSFLKKEHLLYKRFKGKINEIIENRKDEYINHYLYKYKNVPFWVLVKSFSLGTLSNFLKITTQDIKQKITRHYDSLSEKEIITYLAFLTLFRNESAHNKRIFSLKYKMKKIPIQSKIGENIFIKHFEKEITNNRNDFFAIILILKKMLSKNDFQEFFEKIKCELEILESCIDKEAFIKIKNEMGLPKNWQDIENL